MPRPPIDDEFFDGNDMTSDTVEPTQMVTFSQGPQVFEYLPFVREEKASDREVEADDAPQE